MGMSNWFSNFRCLSESGFTSMTQISPIFGEVDCQIKVSYVVWELIFNSHPAVYTLRSLFGHYGARIQSSPAVVKVFLLGRFHCSRTNCLPTFRFHYKYPPFSNFALTDFLKPAIVCTCHSWISNPIIKLSATITPRCSNMTNTPSPMKARLVHPLRPSCTPAQNRWTAPLSHNTRCTP